jgi:large subunit ribosomal protein L6
LELAEKFFAQLINMSRIGKKPIGIPSGTTVTVTDGTVVIKGSKGELSLKLLPEVSIEVKEDKIVVSRINDEKESRARHGLMRSLISNMVDGVGKGYEKKLEIIGVGYKAQGKGKAVSLSLGFSHPVEYKAPDGIDVQNDPNNKQILIISGIDKQLVGQAAADIRSFRPPEPYKGKGVRYVDEYVQRKVGKAVGKAE